MSPKSNKNNLNSLIFHYSCPLLDWATLNRGRVTYYALFWISLFLAFLIQGFHQWVLKGQFSFCVFELGSYYGHLEEGKQRSSYLDLPILFLPWVSYFCNSPCLILLNLLDCWHVFWWSVVALVMAIMSSLPAMEIKDINIESEFHIDKSNKNMSIDNVFLWKIR